MDAPQKPPEPTPVLDPKEQLELRVRVAERAHDLETAFGKSANEAAVKAGEEAIGHDPDKRRQLGCHARLYRNDGFEVSLIDGAAWPDKRTADLLRERAGGGDDRDRSFIFYESDDR